MRVNTIKFIFIFTLLFSFLPLSAHSIPLTYDFNGTFHSGYFTGEDYTFSLSYNTDDIGWAGNRYEVSGSHVITLLGYTFGSGTTQFWHTNRVRALGINLDISPTYLYEFNLYFNSSFNPYAPLPMNYLNLSTSHFSFGSFDIQPLGTGLSYGLVNPVPEPTTILMLGSGLIGFIVLRKKFTTS